MGTGRDEHDLCLLPRHKVGERRNQRFHLLLEHGTAFPAGDRFSVRGIRRVSEQRTDAVGHLGRKNMLEFARLGLGAVKSKEIIEQTKRKSMPTHQFPASLLTLGAHLHGLTFNIDPSVLSQIPENSLAAVDLATLKNLVPGERSLFPQRPDDFKELIFFFYFRQNTQRGMAGLSLDGIHFFVLRHCSSLK